MLEALAPDVQAYAALPPPVPQFLEGMGLPSAAGGEPYSFLKDQSLQAAAEYACGGISPGLEAAVQLLEAQSPLQHVRRLLQPGVVPPFLRPSVVDWIRLATGSLRLEDFKSNSAHPGTPLSSWSQVPFIMLLTLHPDKTHTQPSSFAASFRACLELLGPTPEWAAMLAMVLQHGAILRLRLNSSPIEAWDNCLQVALQHMVQRKQGPVEDIDAFYASPAGSDWPDSLADAYRIRLCILVCMLKPVGHLSHRSVYSPASVSVAQSNALKLCMSHCVFCTLQAPKIPPAVTKFQKQYRAFFKQLDRVLVETVSNCEGTIKLGTSQKELYTDGSMQDWAQGRRGYSPTAAEALEFGIPQATPKPRASRWDGVPAYAGPGSSGGSGSGGTRSSSTPGSGAPRARSTPGSGVPGCGSQRSSSPSTSSGANFGQANPSWWDRQRDQASPRPGSCEGDFPPRKRGKRGQPSKAVFAPPCNEQWSREGDGRPAADESEDDY